MDFQFTPEQQALRKEFEAFAVEEAKRAPIGWGGTVEDQFSEEGWPYHLSVVANVAAQGWLCLPWAKEYGGLGYGPIEQLIFHEVMAYHRVPAIPMHFMSVAASIMEYGTEEQKKEWLPRMARGEIYWAEGLSEPNAGSDLASLRTRAVEDGDDYVIDGQKVWTTGGHRSDHIFVLARTHPDSSMRHRGLTFFINEIGPGVEFRPLIYMNGAHSYNETYFDRFRVPKRNIVGEVNRGWYVMQAGRNYARAEITAAGGKRDLEEFIEYCKETSIGGKTLASNPIVRQKLVELAIEFEASIKMAYWVGWLQTKGQQVGGEAAACGYYSRELQARLPRTATEILGLYGIVKPGSKWAPLLGKFEEHYQWATSFTIAGGTTQIRKNIVAWTGLGLPRSS